MPKLVSWSDTWLCSTRGPHLSGEMLWCGFFPTHTKVEAWGGEHTQSLSTPTHRGVGMFQKQLCHAWEHLHNSMNLLLNWYDFSVHSHEKQQFLSKLPYMEVHFWCPEDAPKLSQGSRATWKHRGPWYESHQCVWHGCTQFALTCSAYSDTRRECRELESG